MKIGIDIGGSHIALGIINDKNEVIEKLEKSFLDEEKSKIVGTIESFLETNLEKIKKEIPIEKIGVAVPGNARDGKIIKTVNLGINDYDISSFIKRYIDVPVIVRNDGKCATLAEYTNMKQKGEIKENANMVNLTIGTGIGAGVIYNGKLLQGNIFDGFEIGHTIIKENGIPCKCGKRGCFERYGSIVEHKRVLEDALGLSHEISGEELRKHMAENEEKIKDIEETYIQDLAIGISNIINIFEPDVVVIGGGFVHYKHLYLEKLKDKLINSTLLFNRRNEINLKCAELGNNAGMIGATI